MSSSSHLKLNLVEGSISFQYTLEAALELKAALLELMHALKQVSQAAQSGQRPTPQSALEYQHNGDVFLEVFCNPNIWPSPFAAKVLVTVRDDRMRLNSEAELPRILEDVTTYLDNEH